MADVDLCGAENGSPRRHSSNHEDEFLHMWEGDVIRAARSRAWRTGNSDISEFAQEARIRLWRMLRKGGTTPSTHYVRTVIANAVRTTPTVDRALEDAIALDEADIIDSARSQCDQFAVSSVRAWLGRLPSVLQNLYHLLYVRELTQREAALVLGVSQPRVAQLHQALLMSGRCDLERIAA